MSFDNMFKFRPGRTLALRLTLWYAVCFAASSLCAVLVFYVSVSSMVQRRTDQGLVNELSEFSSIFKLRGDSALMEAMRIEAESEGTGEAFLRVIKPDGQVIGSTDLSSWKGVGVNRTILERIAGGESYVLETLSFPERPCKARLIYGDMSKGRILQMGVSLEEDEQFLETLRSLFGACLAVIIAFSAIIGWVMAGHALSGIEEVTETAMEISRGTFHRRVTVKSRDDELVRLSMAFNRMLDHIHELIAGMREMTDNIAHDLKTPITRIRCLAEAELNRGDSSGSCRNLAADTMEECDYLLQMINTMLMISEAEAGVAAFTKEEVDMAGLILDVSDLFHPIAEERGIALLLDLSETASVTGDKAGFQRLMVNLMENAVKYTPSGGTVKVSVQKDDHHVSIAVQDTGIGISESDLPHIFKRLYRCDASRSQPGFGLGLSLAMAVARAHGGGINVTSKTGEGSTFTVTLPR
ncbi:MAG: two-component sensor histidine kinase [Deltaproteobacteria bacterium HGW-Deltaproteobacteria-21]|nr:MAG: two-component sensor histidine kinase [Deltaproteobacteria bacterium HGW-Deltaproteobacteria-21]